MKRRGEARDAGRATRRRVVLLVVLVALALGAACARVAEESLATAASPTAAWTAASASGAGPLATPGGSPTEAAIETATPPTGGGGSAVATGSPAIRPGLPPRFPVMPAASPAPLPADPGVVARWTVPRVGSAAYDFYSAALPTAGFPIVGRYPTENAALIRFRAFPDEIWQVLMEAAGGGTLVTVQTDRP